MQILASEQIAQVSGSSFSSGFSAGNNAGAAAHNDIMEANGIVTVLKTLGKLAELF